MGNDDIIYLKKRLWICFSVGSKLFDLVEDAVREFVAVEFRIDVRYLSSFLLFFKLLSIGVKSFEYFIQIIEMDGHSSCLCMSTVPEEEIICSFQHLYDIEIIGASEASYSLLVVSIDPEYE